MNKELLKLHWNYQIKDFLLKNNLQTTTKKITFELTIKMVSNLIGLTEKKTISDVMKIPTNAPKKKSPKNRHQHSDTIDGSTRGISTTPT